MKRTILTYILTAVISTITAQTAGTAPTMAELFKEMPDSLLPYITHNDRLDMIDYLDAKMKAEVTNKLNGKSTLDSISANYLHLTLNEAVTVEMGTLPTEKLTADSCSHVICVITTYGSPAIESTLKFYTAKWNDWQPAKPMVPEEILPPTQPDSFVTAKFGENVSEIILTLSKPVISDENTPQNEEKRQKSVKWGGNTII